MEPEGILWYPFFFPFFPSHYGTVIVNPMAVRSLQILKSLWDMNGQIVEYCSPWMKKDEMCNLKSVFDVLDVFGVETRKSFFFFWLLLE